MGRQERYFQADNKYGSTLSSSHESERALFLPPRSPNRQKHKQEKILKVCAMKKEASPPCNLAYIAT